jgi:hypothetical protein
MGKEENLKAAYMFGVSCSSTWSKLKGSPKPSWHTSVDRENIKRNLQFLIQGAGREIPEHKVIWASHSFILFSSFVLSFPNLSLSCWGPEAAEAGQASEPVKGGEAFFSDEGNCGPNQCIPIASFAFGTSLRCSC